MDDEFKILVPKDIPSPEQYENGPGTEWYEQWKNLTPRESALRQAGFLIAVAQGAANDSKESRDRREDARNAGARALIAYCNIARAADDLPYKNSDEFFRSLNNLMGYAFEIGQLSGTRDIRAREYFKPHIIFDLRNGNAAAARNGNSAKHQRLLEAVRGEVEAVKSTREMAVSIKFAQFIRQGVLARLGVKEPKNEKQWPSDEAIKKCVKEIKEGKSAKKDPCVG